MLPCPVCGTAGSLDGLGGVESHRDSNAIRLAVPLEYRVRRSAHKSHKAVLRYVRSTRSAAGDL